MWSKRRDEAAGTTRAERAQKAAHDKAVSWQQCEACSYDISTGEGSRSCHWGACPYLPEELDVFCPTCNYDFFTREGAPECGETPRCDYARKVASGRVAVVREWMAQHPSVTPEELLQGPKA